jgi:hypothetical protein
MSISKFNKGKKFSFNYDSKSIRFLKMADFIKEFGLNVNMIIKSCHISHGNYGDGATFIVKTPAGEIIGINAPKHMVKDVQNILDDNEVIDQIDNEKAAISAYAYTDRDGNERYSFNFVDLK